MREFALTTLFILCYIFSLIFVPVLLISIVSGIVFVLELFGIGG